jgi:RNA polymerase sigma-70 factor (ECF subfamily)
MDAELQIHPADRHGDASIPPCGSPRPRDHVHFGPEERGFVFSVAKKFVRDDDDAADVTQDAMLLAYRHRDSFRGDSRYRTWLYRIAATTALSHLRRVRRRRDEVAPLVPLGDDPVWEPPADGPSPEDEVGSHEAARLVRGHLEGLGDKYRRVFLMRVEDDCSEAEIASRLGLSVATVKIRTHRARKYLRERMAAAL